MAFIMVTVLLFFALFTGIVAQCPPAQLILPCDCSGMEAFPIVVCRNIHEMDVLVRVFNRSGDRRFTNFALYESSIMYLPAIAISSKQIVNINIVNSTMTSIFDTNPREDNQIVFIMLNNVRFQRGPGWELFKNLKKLSYFKADNSEIKSLGKSFIQNMSPGLKELYLTDAKLKKIYPNAFQNLGQLTHLSVTNSFLKELKRSMFATPSELAFIDFSGNEIETLPDDLFSNFSNLIAVNFNRNKISTVSEVVFGKDYDKLREIELESNPLNCDCSMKWFVVKRRIIVTGKCDLPDDKKGRNVVDLTAADLNYC